MGHTTAGNSTLVSNPIFLIDWLKNHNTNNQHIGGSVSEVTSGQWCLRLGVNILKSV